MVPFTVDNQQHYLADALNELLAVTEGKPFDLATAYFAISGYREVHDRLHKVGAFRLLIGSDPQAGSEIGLMPNDRKILQARLFTHDDEPTGNKAAQSVEYLSEGVDKRETGGIGFATALATVLRA